MSTPKVDTRVTFDVAAEDGSGFTSYDLEMVREDADRFAAKVAESDPQSGAMFCQECPTGDNVACPHDAPRFRYLAVGNLRVRPLNA